MSTTEPKLRAKGVLPERVAKAIEEILGYQWEAEVEDFLAGESGPEAGHIFRALAALDGWFYGHDATPEELAADYYPEESKELARSRARGPRGT